MEFLNLEIENFRHIQNQNIELGSVLTAIAGQNGTGKSTILGWIAQACDTKLKNRTLLDNPYKSKYSEIFRFCPEQDYSKTYHVNLHYKDGLIEFTKEMSTRLSESGERYRVDFDKRGKALDHPVVYMGLKRLIPLASEKNISLHNVYLNNTEKNHFAKLSQEILFLTRDVIEAECVKSTNKQIFAMKTNDYGHLGNSAGQDNLGQIISSVLSFTKLKNELGEKYQGGILLIDEIDATLYAGSQVKLVDKLYGLAKNLNLQIIFTTHSLEILEHLSKKIGAESKINFLKWKNKNVINDVNPNINLIRNIIKVEIGSAKQVEKKQFICEDKVAELWCKNLLNGQDIKNYIQINMGPFPQGTLLEMSKSKLSIFKHINYILDGDCKNSKSKSEKVAYLPGNFKPEKILFDFIFNLDDNDEFWDHNKNFTHQTCFGNYSDKAHKRWFQDPQLKLFFGQNYSRLFNRWKKENKGEVDIFISQLRNLSKLG